MAGASDRVVFGAPPIADVRVVDRSPGRTEVRVASNSAFTLYASDVVGEVRTELGSVRGANAQAPGPQEACTTAMGFSTAIYGASRKTARSPGSRASQSVTLVVLHSVHAEPDIHAEAGARRTVGDCSG